MKRFVKRFAATGIATFALASMGAAGASAATFTYSATGSLTGTQTTSHVFTFGTSSVTCKKAHTSGTIVSTNFGSQHYTVSYSECAATIPGAGTFPVTITGGTYELYAAGTLDIDSTTTISIPALGCSFKFGPQKGLKSVTYTNKAGKIEAHTAVSGIVYTGSGGFCASGVNGGYHGSSLIERVGGGTVVWDA